MRDVAALGARAGAGAQRIGRTLALSSIVGVVAGLGAIAFQAMCQLGMHVFLERFAGYRQEGPAGERALFAPLAVVFRPWLLPVVPALGGLATGWIVQRFAPEAAGHGTDEAVDAFHRKGGVIRGRVPIVKTIASAITLGSGGSGGREGPIAQIGAGFGSFLAGRLGLATQERRVLLACGVGAGVGSIFRAPLAGALFAAEVLYSDPEFEADVIIPAALATIVAYCVFSLAFGFGALFATPHLTFRSAWELIPYTVLAVVVALAAGLFATTFAGTRRLFARLPVPKTLRPALGGLVTGLLALGAWAWLRDMRVLDVMGFGYGSIQQALQGHLGLGLLLAIAFGKMLTTSLSIGSGGSGGVFGPSMVIGGALGGAVGLLAQRVLPPGMVEPAAFVPVGMAGFFAAAANTPISTLVMVSEMTGNYELLLPALWVCALAYLVGRRWTLYEAQVPSRLHSPAHRALLARALLRDLRVRDVTGARRVHTVPEGAPVADVLQTFVRSSQHVLPVVGAGGLLRGVVTLEQVQQILDEDPRWLPLVAGDLARPLAFTLSPDDDLEHALARLEETGLEELPVTTAGSPGQVLALLSRRDLLAAYTRGRAGAPVATSATTPGA